MALCDATARLGRCCRHVWTRPCPRELTFPETDFRFLRALILEAFLERFSIYTTSHFTEKYEKQARENVTASVLVLRGGTPEA